MHQLRRHMALLGHPVLGDARYTYGYASRHPDAPIRLTHAQAQQAMATPFGFTCDHPYCTPDTAAAVSYAFWASQRLGLASKQLGPGPATESEQLGSASQQSEVLATSSLPEAPLHITSEAVMGRTPPKKIKDRPLPAASASTRLDPPVTASGIQKGRSKGAETEPFQASLQLNRPNRAVAPQQSMQAANPAKGFDPCLTDLSLEAHMRLAAGAPHYAATLAKQDRSAMAQHQIQELPAELQRVLCLWAVKLMMPHPLTQAEMQFSIPDPPMFHHMRDAEADLAWKLRQKNSQ